MGGGGAGIRAALALAVACSLAGAATAHARTVQGVRFETALAPRETALALHGAGVMRWRSLLDVYAAALYLPPGTDPARVLDDVPKRLEIEYFVGFDAEDFVRATTASLPRNATAAELEPMAERIGRLNALYRDVEAGDRYALTYVPGAGTELSLNGVALGTVPGADLARAVFAIWLGAEPLDVSLKAQLLGRAEATR